MQTMQTNKQCKQTNNANNANKQTRQTNKQCKQTNKQCKQTNNANKKTNKQCNQCKQTNKQTNNQTFTTVVCSLGVYKTLQHYCLLQYCYFVLAEIVAVFSGFWSLQLVHNECITPTIFIYVISASYEIYKIVEYDADMFTNPLHILPIMIKRFYWSFHPEFCFRKPCIEIANMT